ncbi:Zygote defective protein 12, partial [Bienertia sinuspersici]
TTRLGNSSSESEDFNQGGGRDVCATKAISSRPRRRTVIPDWPEHKKFDEKEEAIAFVKHDVDGKRYLVRGPVQPRDVWNDRVLNSTSKTRSKGPPYLPKFQEKAKGKFSELDFYKSVYTMKDGSFKEGTLSQQFMSRVDIENEVFNDLMYTGEVPKQPLNYGFGVKQSYIFGVQGLLRKEGSSYVDHSAVQMENLKVEFSAIKKQNEDLRQKNLALESKFDDTTQSFKAIASHLVQVLKEVRNGNPSAHLLDGAESAIKLIAL